MIGILSLLAAATVYASSGRKMDPQACLKLQGLAGSDEDASPVLALCLSQLPESATLNLPPGRYHLRTPLSIAQPVTIETKPSARRSCQKGDSRYCAVLVVGKIAPQRTPGIMPVEIKAANVHLRSIAIMGSQDRGEDWEKRICLDERLRPLGGGIRVRGSGFRMENVLLKNASCYTALEIMPLAKRPAIKNSIIGPNGRHGDKMWADGVTIHDTTDAVIENNRFQDNTDVQLIFGGCRNCVVRRNTFRHSQAFIHASFAELMLHSWPNTSGDFSGSTISQNDIDCGLARRCGFGIMIGGEPWYPARTFGGLVWGNQIANALLGLNVDRLTGNMTIMKNIVTNSGGISKSDCGTKAWPSVNISPASIPFARTDARKHGSMDTARCLLLRQE